jgi:hypothetical protein
MSGLFYREPTVNALRGAIEMFSRLEDLFDPRASRENAARFSPEIFREKFGNFVRESWERHAKEGGLKPAGKDKDGWI